MEGQISLTPSSIWKERETVYEPLSKHLLYNAMEGIGVTSCTLWRSHYEQYRQLAFCQKRAFVNHITNR